jgi:hypothetical protein
MTLSEIFDIIRPRIERTFWEAWLEEGFEIGDLTKPPAGVAADYWREAKERCWARADARQAALYAEYDIANHPEMAFANKAETASERPF